MNRSSVPWLIRAIVGAALMALTLDLTACGSTAAQPAPPPACTDSTVETAVPAGIPFDTTLLGFQELVEPQAAVVQQCLQANPAVHDKALDDDTAVVYRTGGIFQNVIDDNSQPPDPYYPYYLGLRGLADQIDSGDYPAMSTEVQNILLNQAVRINIANGDVHQAYRLEGNRLVPQMGPVLYNVGTVVTDDTDPADSPLFVNGHTSHKKVHKTRPSVPTRVVAPAAPVRRSAPAAVPPARAGAPAVVTTNQAVPPPARADSTVKPTTKPTTTTKTSTAKRRCTATIKTNCVK